MGVLQFKFDDGPSNPGTPGKEASWTELGLTAKASPGIPTDKAPGTGEEALPAKGIFDSILGKEGLAALHLDGEEEAIKKGKPMPVESLKPGPVDFLTVYIRDQVDGTKIFKSILEEEAGKRGYIFFESEGTEEKFFCLWCQNDERALGTLVDFAMNVLKEKNGENGGLGCVFLGRKTATGFEELKKEMRDIVKSQGYKNGFLIAREVYDHQNGRLKGRAGSAYTTKILDDGEPEFFSIQEHRFEITLTSGGPETLIGYEKELNDLLNFLRAQNVNLIYVNGEPGIGKSRLTGEALNLHLSNTHDLQTKIISFPPNERKVAFGSFKSFLRQLADFLPENKLLAQLLATEISEEKDLEEISRAVVAIFQAQVKSVPQLLVLDDMHYLDSKSVKVIFTNLIEKLRKIGVKIVMISRAGIYCSDEQKRYVSRQNPDSEANKNDFREIQLNGLEFEKNPELINRFLGYQIFKQAQADGLLRDGWRFEDFFLDLVAKRADNSPFVMTAIGDYLRQNRNGIEYDQRAKKIIVKTDMLSLLRGSEVGDGEATAFYRAIIEMIGEKDPAAREFLEILTLLGRSVPVKSVEIEQNRQNTSDNRHNSDVISGRPSFSGGILAKSSPALMIRALSLQSLQTLEEAGLIAKEGKADNPLEQRYILRHEILGDICGNLITKEKMQNLTERLLSHACTEFVSAGPHFHYLKILLRNISTAMPKFKGDDFNYDKLKNGKLETFESLFNHFCQSKHTDHRQMLDLCEFALENFFRYLTEAEQKGEKITDYERFLTDFGHQIGFLFDANPQAQKTLKTVCLRYLKSSIALGQISKNWEIVKNLLATKALRRYQDKGEQNEAYLLEFEKAYLDSDQETQERLIESCKSILRANSSDEVLKSEIALMEMKNYWVRFYDKTDPAILEKMRLLAKEAQAYLENPPRQKYLTDGKFLQNNPSLRKIAFNQLSVKRLELRARLKFLRAESLQQVDEDAGRFDIVRHRKEGVNAENLTMALKQTLSELETLEKRYTLLIETYSSPDDYVIMRNYLDVVEEKATVLSNLGENSAIDTYENLYALAFKNEDFLLAARAMHLCADDMLILAMLNYQDEKQFREYLNGAYQRYAKLALPLVDNKIPFNAFALRIQILRLLARWFERYADRAETEEIARVARIAEEHSKILFSNENFTAFYPCTCDETAKNKIPVFYDALGALGYLIHTIGGKTRIKFDSHPVLIPSDQMPGLIEMAIEYADELNPDQFGDRERKTLGLATLASQF